MASKGERVECWFLVPLVRNQDRGHHSVELWRLLLEELYTLAAGWTGPQEVLIWRAVYEDVEPAPGGWRDTTTGKIVGDESRKYTVILPKEKIEDLRELLVRAANSFDQDEMLLLVQGKDLSVKRNPAKGLLKGDVRAP